jgi:hypothetical protein
VAAGQALQVHESRRYPAPACCARRKLSGHYAGEQEHIMSAPIANLLATVASLATVCSVVGMSGNAWAEDMGASQHAPAELAKWRSSLIDASDAHVNPEWKSALGTIDPGDSAERRAAPGDVGPRHALRYGVRHSPGSFDVPKSTR